MKQIKISDFAAGVKEQQYEYQSFLPNNVYNQWLIQDHELILEIGEANRLLGSLDAYADLVPNIDYFIKMHITKEATTSSKIEGTKTSFEEALLTDVVDLDPEKRDDWLEVNNYIRVVNHSINQLDKLPISSRLIKNVHAILLEGARGKNKLPGEFRNSQNWIGNSLKNAIYIPPTHPHIANLMSDLENLINAELLDDKISVPHLIRIAIIHYQFETIHPFLDGNGRIGRLLITLYFIEKRILKRPTLYLSDYFERHRREYYNRLTAVREKNDLSGWIKFFLKGVIETSKNSIQTFQDIINLRQHIELEILPQIGRRQKDAQLLINALYGQPIMDGNTIAKVLDKHPSSSNRLINEMVALDLLKETTGYKRNRTFIFWPYVEIFKK